MEYIILASIFVVDLTLSVLGYAMREYSKFRVSELVDELRREDKDRGRIYEKKRDRIFAFFDGSDKRYLPFFLCAYVLDVIFLVMVSELLGAEGFVGGYLILLVLAVYIVTIYAFCRLFALSAAEQRAETIILKRIGTIRLLAFLLFPAGLLTSGLDRLISRFTSVLGAADQDPQEDVEDEILDSITEGVEDGLLEEDEKRMIESVLKLDDSDVREIMTPRTDLVSVDAESSFEEVIKTVDDSGFSRIPVCGNDIDDIIGILYAKDLIKYAGQQVPAENPIKGILREAVFIPETKKVSELFQEIREKKNHFAVILDEYGGTAGIVTAEDIIEEIVGEIEDEYDAHNEDQKVEWRSENTAEVDARIDIEELNQEMDIALPDEAEFESLGGFLASEMGKIPQLNETIDYDNLTFKVTKGTKRKLLRVEVTKRIDTGDGEES